MAQDIPQTNISNWGRRPAYLQALVNRLSRGFNEALNGFSDEGWTLIGNDGMDDVTILVNSNPEKLMGFNISFTNEYNSIFNAVLCSKASVLLQNVPPAILLRFLGEYRSEWADNIDTYAASASKIGPCTFQGLGVEIPVVKSSFHWPRLSIMKRQVHRLLEVIKLEGVSHMPDDAMMIRDIFHLQLCGGMDEKAVGTCAELVFAPIDAAFAEDAPLLQIVPLGFGKVASSPNRTVDLASALETGKGGNKPSNDLAVTSSTSRSAMTIAFQFAFESHMQETVASMARQYVRSIISSVQRAALALSSAPLGPNAVLRPPLGTLEAHTLSGWICQIHRSFLFSPLRTRLVLTCLRRPWSHFKIFDAHGRKNLCSEIPHIMHQGFASLQGGICLSSMSRPISYERALAWKVLNEDDDPHCSASCSSIWSFV